MTLPSVNPLCLSRRIDTWQIVYLSYKDPCPTKSIHKSKIKVRTLMSHGRSWTAMELARIHKFQLPVAS